MDGVEIGWFFSAPNDKVAQLASERMTVALMTDPSSGLSGAQCSQHIKMRVLPVSKLGPGTHDAAIQELFEKDSSIYAQSRVGRFAKQDVHGFPGYIFTTAFNSTEDGVGKTEERTYLVVETGKHLIYFFRSAYFDTSRRDACLNMHGTLYQGIAESIRPGASF